MVLSNSLGDRVDETEKNLTREYTSGSRGKSHPTWGDATMKAGNLIRRLLAVAGIIGLVAGGVFLPDRTSAAEKVIFQFDWVPYGKYTGYIVARDKRFGDYKSFGTKRVSCFTTRGKRSWWW